MKRVLIVLMMLVSMVCIAGTVSAESPELAGFSVEEKETMEENYQKYRYILDRLNAEYGTSVRFSTADEIKRVGAAVPEITMSSAEFEVYVRNLINESSAADAKAKAMAAFSEVRTAVRYEYESLSCKNVGDTLVYTANFNNDPSINTQAVVQSSSETVFASSTEDQRTHIDHEGSENCIYSCEHPVNNCSSADIWSEEKVENFLREYQEVSSDAEMAAFMSKYSGIPYTEADLKEMRSTITALPENSYETQAFCDHVYRAVCQGNHSTPNNNCIVARCERFALCTYGCGSSTTVITSCTEHLWSEGWCGRTCTRCKTVEMFHDPGGCWYCSYDGL